MRVLYFCPFCKAQRKDHVRDIPGDSLRGYGLELQIARFKVKYEEFPDLENSLILE